MANSSTPLDLITASQSGKEVTANALFDAASNAMLFGRRASTTTGLTWGYYGGMLMVDGALTNINNGTRSLTGRFRLTKPPACTSIVGLTHITMLVLLCYVHT